MKSSFRIVAAAGMAACLFAAAARADLPSVFDQLPTDALVVIATPSLSHLDRETGNLLTAIDMAGVGAPSQLLQMVNLKNGVNMDGPAALVVMPGDFEGDEQPIFAVLPVTDYAEVLGNFGGKPGAAGGLDTFEMHGEKAFARKLDNGFMAFGPTESVLTKFNGKPGNLAAFKAALGKEGMSVADKAEIIAVANVQAMAPYFDKWKAGMAKGLEDAEQAGGEQAAQMKAAIAMMDGFIEDFRRDGRTVAAGIDAGASGVVFDVAVMFAEGSETAKLAQGAGRASSLLRALPGKPFLLAGAFDLAHAASKEMMNTVAAMQNQMGGGVGLMGGLDVSKILPSVSGQAVAIYPNPAGPMAGVLANTVTYYESKDPKALTAQMKTLFEEMGGAEGPMKFTSTYTPNATQVDGVQVDAFDIQPQPGNDPMSMQMMQMMAIMYGPGGMGGYVATTDKGVVQTMSKNSALLKDALAAAKGGAGASFTEDASVKALAARLPEGRIAEGYVGTKSVLEQVLPFMQMFMPIRIDVPADLPPLAGGIAANGGAIRATAVIPAQVLRLGGKAYQEMQNMTAPGDMGGEEGAEEKPRF